MAGLRATNEMMLRDFEEKQAANNEKEIEERDLKVCSVLKIKTVLLHYFCFSLIQLVQS